MRLVWLMAAFLLAAGVTRTAAAERRTSGFRHATALEVTLLDGWRAQTPRVDLGAPSGGQKDAGEPGQDLSQAVERVWSQARVYRKPGGAQIIVRGRF